jgi:hypothetical protein
MKLPDPIVAAAIRGAYNAVGTGAFVALSTWAVTDDPRVIITASGMAGLGVLGFRGVGEGMFDQLRKPNQNVPPATLVDDERPGV